MTRTIFLSVILSLAGVALAQGQTSTPIATINGAIIHDSDLDGLEGQLFQIRKQEYDIKKKALDSLIEQKLIEAEAARLGITLPQLYEREVNSKVREPSDGEIEAFYLAQQDRALHPLSEVRPQVRMALRQARLAQARQDYIDRLRQRAKVEILLDVPRVQVGYDPARLKGAADAPVRIVEFADYECPYCRSEEETIRALVAKYGTRVSLAYRDFPLNNIHPRAQLAAEASRCAAEQGKFWEYHDRLFTNPVKLEPADLKEHAKAAGLDLEKFAPCLDQRKQQDTVDKDAQDGHDAGVSGTPTFFVNGIYLEGAQPASEFEKIIDDELARRAVTLNGLAPQPRSRANRRP